MPAAVEHSRSGRGSYVWFLFEEALPATLARKFGSFLLTETMERRPDVGLDSYARLFPNQDTETEGLARARLHGSWWREKGKKRATS